MAIQILGGRYQILKHLGGGGFGQTFLAADLHLPGNPQCVVKQLKPQKNEGVSLESARRLFDAEAQALYQLGTHSCIPRLLAHFEENEQFYLVQEYVRGQLLSQRLQEVAPMEESAVVQLLIDVLDPLSFVHQHQVIHRDIKPSNLIRRDEDGKVVLIDFGAVKQVSCQRVEVEGQISITIAVGSMGYMPNEQLAGQPCLSSDVYAVGMLALQALTGIDPRRFRKDLKTSEIIWHDLANVSTSLQKVLDRMIRYDYRQRYHTAQEALLALQGLTRGNPVASQRLDFEECWVGQPEEAHLVWLERADDFFQRGRYGDAIATYERFLQVQPSYDQAWFKLGLAQEHLDNYEAAVNAYDRVLQLKPQDYLAWLKRAKALEQLQCLEDALVAYNEVLRLQPDKYWVWCDRALVLRQLDRLEAALEALERAIQLKPDFQHALDCRRDILKSLHRVEQLYQLQHYDEAIAACQQVIRTTPEDTTAWLMQAMAQENLNQLAAAALSYDRVVRLQPDDHVAWFKLADVLAKLKRYRQAALAYSQVIRIQPGNHWAWFQRGQMLENLDRLEKAIAAYNQAVALKPEFQSALSARQRIIEQLLVRPTAPSRS